MPLGTKVGIGPGRIGIVLHGDPAPLSKVAQPPISGPCYIVAKRSPISATAEHLFIKINNAFLTFFLFS